jgi:hypothetical protein
MKHIKLFEEFSATFEAQTKLTPEQEKFLNRSVGGTWSLNPQTGLVDVDGYVNCSNEGLQDLKGVRFGNVSGSFSCSYNKLTSLAGAPQTVGKDFHCDMNKLTSLVGAPQAVGGINAFTVSGTTGSFWCMNNQLTSLVGAPQAVGGDFRCHNNVLTSLEGAPQTVKWGFLCSNNQLTSLVGAPKTVGKEFDCSNNQLTSLVGAPQKVGDEFDCRNNPQLTSLEGAPKAKRIASDINKTTVAPRSFSIASEFEDYENGKTYDLQGEWEDFNFSVKGDTVIFSGKAYIGDVKGSYSDKRGLEMTMMVDIFTFADWFKDNPVKIIYRVNKIKPEDVIGDIHNTLAAINDSGTDWESVKDVSKFLRDNGLKTTSKILEPED